MSEEEFEEHVQAQEQAHHEEPATQNADFAAATTSQPKEEVSQDLFAAFSVGDVK